MVTLATLLTFFEPGKEKLASGFPLYRQILNSEVEQNGCSDWSRLLHPSAWPSASARPTAILRQLVLLLESKEKEKSWPCLVKISQNGWQNFWHVTSAVNTVQRSLENFETAWFLRYWISFWRFQGKVAKIVPGASFFCHFWYFSSTFELSIQGMKKTCKYLWLLRQFGRRGEWRPLETEIPDLAGPVKVECSYSSSDAQCNNAKLLDFSF